MNIDFAIKFAKNEIQPTTINRFAKSQFNILSKEYPHSMGLNNKIDVLELIDTFSKQRQEGIKTANKNITSLKKFSEEMEKTIRMFIDSQYNKLASSDLIKQSELVQKNVKELNNVFDNQNHSNTSAPMTLEMFDLLSHFKKF